MPLIKENELTDDVWQTLADDQECQEDGAFILSYDRLAEQFDSLLTKKIKLGVTITNNIEAEDLQPYISKLDLIVLQFPKFADGRAYSQARILREHLGYEGELRATGDVLPDQSVLMMRCGIDSFEVADGISIETWKRCVEILNTNYQRSYAVTGDEVRVE